MAARVYPSDRLRNIALLGHAQSGKTALCDAILHLTGASSRLGSTADGTSVTDYEPEEVARGHSLQSAFAWAEFRRHRFNLIDTPGDQSFLYDALSSAQGADLAVLVINGTEGVEVNTDRLWAHLVERRTPRVVFVSRMDSARADRERVLGDIREHFEQEPIEAQLPIGSGQSFAGVIDLLSLDAFTGEADGEEPEVPDALHAEAVAARQLLVEAVASSDDELLEHYLETFELTDEQLRAGYRAAVRDAELLPVYYGAPPELLGVAPLLDALVSSAPSPTNGSGAFLAQVIHTTIDEHAGKLSVIRVLSAGGGTPGAVENVNRDTEERLGGHYLLRGRAREPLDELVAGDIVAVPKLHASRTGDTLADGQDVEPLATVPVPPPMMAYILRPRDRDDEDRLRHAVEAALEEDPSLSTSIDELSHQIVLHGNGTAHLESTAQRMRRRHGVQFETELPAIPYRETLRGSARDIEAKHKKQSGGAGQFAVCVIHAEPLARGAGFEFIDQVTGGAIPKQYIPAVEKGIRDAMRHGAEAGYPVVDVRVTLVDGKSHAVDSSEHAFGSAGAKAFQRAMQRAGNRLLEPVHRVEVTVPTETLGDVTGDIASRRGRVLGMETRGKNTVIEATCPLVELQRYEPVLRSLTSGRGSFVNEFEGYRPVPADLASAVRENSPYRTG